MYSQNDSTEFVVIQSIEICGNNKTKSDIIRRELLFKENDTILQNELGNTIKRSTQNLLNMPLFNDVIIEIKEVTPVYVSIIVNVKERWYLWPDASVYYVDRNFSNWLRELDWGRIDYGIGMVKYNFRGRNEKLSLYTFFGYDEEIYFNYDHLFVDKERQHALSAEFDYKRRKETPYGVKNDQLQQIQFEDGYALKLFSGSVTYTFRKTHHLFQSLNLGYENRIVSDSLLKLNPDYSINGTRHFDYFSLKYKLLDDKRDTRIFPESGHKYDISLTKYGINPFDESAINSFKIAVDLSFYSKLNERLSLNNNIVMTRMFGTQNPFFLTTALGYTYSIRGYEYYAVNGTSGLISKNTFNIKILKKKYFKLKFLPYEKFNNPFITVYVNLYVDGAYVKNSERLYNLNNRFQNTILYGFGGGLVFVSYYDKLLRFDISTNKQGITGLFIHFEAPF